MEQHSETVEIKIYLSGPIDVIKQVCREYCMSGLCITIREVLYIYTGGEEYGVEIGLLNYPRFPSTEEELNKNAVELASKCRDAAFQFSYLIVTKDKTTWNSTRK